MTRTNHLTILDSDIICGRVSINVAAAVVLVGVDREAAVLSTDGFF